LTKELVLPANQIRKTDYVENALRRRGGGGGDDPAGVLKSRIYLFPRIKKGIDKTTNAFRMRVLADPYVV
jgi:hypothetical protein